MRLDDPEHVRLQYGNERRLGARMALYGGDDPARFDPVLEAVVPGRVLEIGGGTGSCGARIRDELGCEVAGIDSSERMVELQRGRGIDARVGDAQELPFDDASFDTAVANYCLYHVRDLDGCLGEIRRVLRPGGRFVGLTTSVEHLHELWRPLGRDLAADVSFTDASGGPLLARHFAHVERRDLRGSVTVDDEAPLRAYLDSSERWAGSSLPPLAYPLRLTVASALFVAS